MQETKHLNIAATLRYAPKGLPLYSPICGECKFENCTSEIIKVSTKDQYLHFYKNGQYYENQGECLLFPSKGRQSWNNWQQTLLPQSVGSVCASLYTSTKKLFLCTSKDIVFLSDKCSFLTDSWNKITKDFSSCMRYATHEETDQFFKELKRRGYKWNGEDVVEEQPEKFDISTLKPFDKVLIRDNDQDYWCVALYGWYVQNEEYPFLCDTSWWKQCVPYKKETEHLIGTKKEAPDFYKTW